MLSLETFTYSRIVVGIISAIIVHFSLENIKYVYLETSPPWVETLYGHRILQPNGSYKSRKILASNQTVNTYLLFWHTFSTAGNVLCISTRVTTTPLREVQAYIFALWIIRRNGNMNDYSKLLVSLQNYFILPLSKLRELGIFLCFVVTF